MVTTGSSAWRVACIIAYCFAFLVFGLQLNVLGPTIPALAHRIHREEAELGPVFTITGFVSTVGALPSGWLTDTLPGHSIMAVALALQAVGFALMPSVRTLWQLNLTYGLVSFTWNFVNTAGNTLVLWIAQDHVSSSHGTVLVNVLHAMFGAGSLMAPVFAEAAAALFGSSIKAYYASAALTAVAAVLLLPLPSPAKPQPLQQRREPQDDIVGRNAESVLTWTSPKLLPALLPAILFVWNSVGIEVAFGGWIYTYVVKHMTLPDRTAGTINAVFWAAFTAGRVMAAALAARVSASALLWGSLPLGLVGAALGMLIQQGNQDAWLCIGAAVLVGLGTSTGFANVLSLLDGYVPVTGAVTGILGATAGAGCMVFPLIVALVAKHTPLHFASLMVVTAASFGVQLAALAWTQLAAERLRRRGVMPLKVKRVVGADQNGDIVEPLLLERNGHDEERSGDAGV